MWMELELTDPPIGKGNVWFGPGGVNLVSPAKTGDRPTVDLGDRKLRMPSGDPNEEVVLVGPGDLVMKAKGSYEHIMVNLQRHMNGKPYGDYTERG